MAERKISEELFKWARVGAQIRLGELRQEEARIHEQFPELFPSNSTPTPKTTPNSKRRKKRRMSPEARKRISEMMKKRWAERRKKNK